MRIALLSTAILIGLAATSGAEAQERPDFASLDANADGQVSQTELAALWTERMGKRFAFVDRNEDGYLTEAELKAAAEAWGGPRRGRPGRVMNRLDQDGDARISLEEMVAAADGSRAFRRLDKNGDGSLSEAEFAEARAAFRARRGQGWLN